ncbi:hypothetical protein [Bradyrhizobium sp.]|uniref:hypothetical protein n=1 Tax=Bradyrhizobium sp. TaxID=376 RepID=UPI003C1BBC41
MALSTLQISDALFKQPSKISVFVMAGFVPAIHVFALIEKERHGTPGHLREDALRALARA